MYYLAIESSCDETSLAFLQVEERSPFQNQKSNFYNQINQIQVISSIISSQIATHAQYGGVVPEVGARLHAEQIHGLFGVVLDLALDKLNLSKTEFYTKLETIFVTAEPGLMSALRVGIEFAKSLQFYIAKQYLQKVKLEFVNHLQGHVASSFYEINNVSQEDNQNQIEKAEVGNSPREGWQSQTDGVFKSDATNIGTARDASTIDLIHFNTANRFLPSLKITSYLDSQIFPHLHLMISGGNTQIRLLNSWQDWQIVGQTIDDAAGECFDKAARMVGIAYPGGATLSKIAGNEYSNPLSLPIAMLQSKDLNISLSGLKTAIRYKIQKAQIPDLVLDQLLSESEIKLLISQQTFENNPKLQFIKEICISTQFAIIEQIKRKIDLAIKQHQPNSIGISGGVSANKVLINKIQKLQSVQNLQTPKIFAPDYSLTGDNAVMIGLAGLMKL